MPGRTRPIDKFAEALAKCSSEVYVFEVINILREEAHIRRLLSMENV